MMTLFICLAVQVNIMDKSTYFFKQLIYITDKKLLL